MRLDERGEVIVISLLGEECGQLWKEIEPHVQRGRKRFVLDLSGVGFLNSMNIAAMIGVRNKLQPSGGRLMLAGLQEPIKAIFRILKLERLFDLNLDVAGAVRAVG